jgi:two-component system, NarL family, sensor histidine kinase LiaS
MRKRSPFETLRWRLALSYTAFTLVLVLGLITVFWGFVLWEEPAEIGYVPALLGGALLAALLLTLPTVALGFVFGLWTSTSLTRRLSHIENVAARWGEGRLDERLDASSADEIGRLASRLNTMADQLGAHIETRRKLAAADERDRLARDLHDSVKQHVFATSMSLGAASEALPGDVPFASQQVAAAAATIQAAQRELSSIIQALRPVGAAELPATLRAHAALWRASHPSIDLRVDVDENAVARSDETATACLRIAQEALANIARHSRATASALELSQRADGVRLRVTDNGVGIAPAGESHGIGLRTMRERAAAVGGKLAIASKAGETSVTFESSR